MIKRLIFDVDGTLITGVNFISPVEATLKQFNLYSKDRVEKFLEAMFTYEKVFNRYHKINYLTHIGGSLDISLDNSFLNIFFEQLKLCIPSENSKLIFSISKLSKQYELVLLMNYFKESQLNRLYKMGIGSFFSECYGEELIKPNEEIYLKACGDHLPNECVMIGDDLYLDIEKAQMLGIHTIFVNTKRLQTDDTNLCVVNSADEITLQLIKQIETRNYQGNHCIL